jgi:hypothetical protein
MYDALLIHHTLAVGWADDRKPNNSMQDSVGLPIVSPTYILQFILKFGHNVAMIKHVAYIINQFKIFLTSFCAIPAISAIISISNPFLCIRNTV